MPPIGDDAQSRLVYHALDKDTATILSENAEATGWLALTSDVLNSLNGFPDSALLQGAFLQDDVCENHEQITIGQLAGEERGRENCVYYEKTRVLELFYRDTACEAVSTETGEPLIPNKFFPRCLVLLVEAVSRRALLEDMLASGRIPTDVLRVNVSYATTISHAPDYEVAAVHAALSVILQAQHNADLVGQDAFDALVEAENAVLEKQEQVTLFSNTFDGLSVAAFPGGLQDPDYLELQQKESSLRNELTTLQGELESLRASAAADCVPSESTTCGRSSVQAPDPWVAADGTPCAGKETLEVYPGAFCSRWGDPVRARLPARVHSAPSDALPVPRRETSTPPAPERPTNSSRTLRPPVSLPAATRSSAASSQTEPYDPESTNSMRPCAPIADSTVKTRCSASSFSKART